MKWIKESEEVFYYSDSKIVKALSRDDLESLKVLARSNKRNRVRICTHNNIESDIHEMFIFHPKDSYVRPHKHINKEESFHLISGRIILVIFDKIGNVVDVLSMGNYTSGKFFYYRIPANTFHSQIFMDDTIFHEVIKGPFDNNDSVLAEWSPNETDNQMVENYLMKLKEHPLVITSSKLFL